MAYAARGYLRRREAPLVMPPQPFAKTAGFRGWAGVPSCFSPVLSGGLRADTRELGGRLTGGLAAPTVRLVD